MSAGFTHLHCHTEYSVLDGQCRIKEILEKCREFDMKSCAITDHGVLFGAIEFYKTAKKMGVKPIIGCELYVAKAGRHDRTQRGEDNYFHFLTLCENETGYFNLCKLSSLGYLEGFYYRPRVDDELLAKYSEGLIATTSCLAGEVPQLILAGKLDQANAALRKYAEMFGKDNFLVELMDHGMPDQQQVNPILAEMAERHGLTLIATNDVHYVNKDDSEPHDALLCIQTNAQIDDENRFRFPTDQVYFRSPGEMRDLFVKWPEAVSNTEKIAERCNVEIPLGRHLIPNYQPPDGRDKVEFLRELVHEGLKERYGKEPKQELVERADFELSVIDQMGFTDFFLVVWDLIAYAREQGIPVGPGRGSCAGSIVAYALKITNIDPIRYGLLFERFLNPERVSMPDFDIDFCYVRREEMIEYTRRTYGRDNVCQIVTFGRMLAKNVVRNVGRVMGMPYPDVDRIAKLIPDELGIRLDDAYEREPRLKELVQSDAQIAKLWRLAKRLEGTVGNCGTHAAGVVICDSPVMDHVALYQAAGTTTVATQIEMKGCEDIGLLKIDFLGLRTLTVVHETVRLVREARGIVIDIDHIEPDDPKAYELLRSGRTTGVFQLESPGMRDLTKRIGLQSLEEICALVALYRPGPMKYIDPYVQGKFQPDSVKYDHPLLEPILRETYGVAVYQEQVMQIVQAVAGFTLGHADILRRAMGKKIVSLMAEQRDKFVEGCKKANNIGPKLASDLFDKIETFAGYGFNKSHSMAYAYVAYQTAFLKANYPSEFMAALLTSESGNLDKVAKYVDECNRMDTAVLPPDVNRSSVNFTVDGNTILFGLFAVKNVGEMPAKAIVAERLAKGPYKDIFDFCARLDAKTLNRRVVESLNKAGAFECTGWTRAQVEASIDAALGGAVAAQREREAGQSSLFDLLGDDAAAANGHTKPAVSEWTEHVTLQAEKEMLGLFVSRHPLQQWGDVLRHYTTTGLTDLADRTEDEPVTIGGLLSQVKHHITAKGKKMAFVTVDTLEGPVEATVFSDIFERCESLLTADAVLVMPAHVNYRKEAPGLIVDDIIPVDQARKRLTKAVHIRMSTLGLETARVDRLAEVLGKHPGGCDVYLHCTLPDAREVTVHATSACMVEPSSGLVNEVEELFGEQSLWFAATNGLPRHRN
jgi:DNA polymerase-3 subunit alpha